MTHSTCKAPVTICSSVSLDYVRTLSDMLSGAPILYLLSEKGYRSLASGGRFARLWLRIVTFAFYPLLLIFTMLRFPRRVYIVTSNCFLAPALACAFARVTGSTVIHLVYDLYPDAVNVLSSSSAPASPVTSFMTHCVERLQSRTFAAAPVTAFIGEYLAAYAEGRFGKMRRRAVIPLAVDSREYPPYEDCPEPQSPLRVHYSGNIGRMHDNELLLACLLSARDQGLFDHGAELFLYISGPFVEAFRAALAHPHIKVHTPLPAAEWRGVAATMDLGIVSLAAAASGVCFPSKTLSMMAAGNAILSLAAPESDLATIVTGAKCGWNIDNSPSRARAEIVSSFCDRLRLAISERTAVAACRTSARQTALERFDTPLIQREWIALLEELT